MASIRKRVRKDGTPSWQVLWRDGDGKQSSVTFLTEPEAVTLKRALDANGGNFTIAQDVIAPAAGTHTVADVAREHIDLMIKPTAHTVSNYRGYLKNHILPTIGGVPVDKLRGIQITAWVRGLMETRTGPDRTMSPNTVAKIFTFLSSVLDTAVRLGYRDGNPCAGVDLPTTERADGDLLFLTVPEFNLLRDHMDAHYRTFISFLVMTGARFGEATAVTVGDVNLSSALATVRINKAWKSDGHRRVYVGPPKTPSSKRTIALPAGLVDMLRPLVKGCPSDALLFTDATGGRVQNDRFYRSFWVPAVKAAQAADKTFVKNPKPHGLRHTHASWLIQNGVEMFKVAKRLGHSSTAMLDQIYGHLMPDAQIESATAIGRAMLGETRALETAKETEQDKSA